MLLLTEGPKTDMKSNVPWGCEPVTPLRPADLEDKVCGGAGVDEEVKLAEEKNPEDISGLFEVSYLLLSRFNDSSM